MLCRARGIGVLLAPLALLFLIDPNLQPRMCPQEPRSREKAQEEVYPPPVELYEAETIPFSAPPPLSFFTGIKCDLSSNIYLVYSDALPSIPSEVITLDTPLPPVRKVAIDSRTVVSYATQSLPDYPLVRREDFAVDPRGTVYALLEAYHRRPDKEHQEIPDLSMPKIPFRLKSLILTEGIATVPTLCSLPYFPRCLASDLGSEPGQRCKLRLLLSATS